MITILRERGYKSFDDIEEGQFFLHNSKLYLKVYETDTYNALSFETSEGAEDILFLEDEEAIPVDVRITILERKD